MYQLRILKPNISFHNVLFWASIRRFSTSSRLFSVGLLLNARYSEVLLTGNYSRSALNIFRRLVLCDPTRPLWALDPSTAKDSERAAGLFSGLRRMWPNIFHLERATRSDNFVVLHISYSFSLVMVHGHLMLRIRLRCLRWHTSSFFKTSLVAAQLEQLYIITEVTIAS